MKGLSTLATLISVLSFPLIFVALLYPHLASSRGRWYGVALYSTIAIGMMLVAVATAPNPHFVDQEWMALDWIVMVSGCGLLLFTIVRKVSAFKRQAILKRKIGSKKNNVRQKTSPGGKEKIKPH